MSTAGPEVAPEETQAASPLHDIVSRMVAMRDQMESEEKEMFAKAEAIRSEREDIDRMLKVIRPKKKVQAKPRPKKADSFAPVEMPTNRRSVEALTKCISVIEGFDGAHFQVGMVETPTGCNRKTVARAIGVMRGENRIRVLGKRPPLARGDYPGGAQAVTFCEIKEED